MAPVTYQVTISVGVPIEEDTPPTDEQVEAFAAAVGQAVFSAIAQGDPGGRVMAFARLPDGLAVGGRVTLELEDTLHPRMRRARSG